MKPSFSFLLSEQKQSVCYMVREISHICRTMDRRAPGSAGERAAAEYMAGVLRGDCGCPEVRVETFRARPAAFYGYFRFSMTLDALCAVCFFLTPWLSILFGCAALMLFLFQFGLYRQIIDPLFPEKEKKVLPGQLF